MAKIIGLPLPSTRQVEKVTNTHFPIESKSGKCSFKEHTPPPIGIDKLTLWVPEFSVMDASRSGLMTRDERSMPIMGEGKRDRSLPWKATMDTSKPPFLFRDAVGQEVRGTKAYLNTELYQLTIQIPKNETMDGQAAISIQMNPSKPYHPYILCSDDATLQDRFGNVYSDLKNRGILLPDDHVITRLDVSRNVVTNEPVRMYGSALRLCNMKRHRSQVLYPDGFRMGNSQWSVILYDKQREMMDKGVEAKELKGNKLMRVEMQLQNAKKIKSKFGIRNMADFYRAGLGHIQEVYMDTMKHDVFRYKEGSNVMPLLPIDDVDGMLHHLCRSGEREPVSRLIMAMGIQSFIQAYPSMDMVKQVMKDAGKKRKAIDNAFKSIMWAMEANSFLYGNELTEGKLIRELIHKVCYAA